MARVGLAWASASFMVDRDGSEAGRCERSCIERSRPRLPVVRVLQDRRESERHVVVHDFFERHTDFTDFECFADRFRAVPQGRQGFCAPVRRVTRFEFLAHACALTQAAATSGQVAHATGVARPCRRSRQDSSSGMRALAPLARATHVARQGGFGCRPCAVATRAHAMQQTFAPRRDQPCPAAGSRGSNRTQIWARGNHPHGLGNARPKLHRGKVRLDLPDEGSILGTSHDPGAGKVATHSPLFGRAVERRHTGNSGIPPNPRVPAPRSSLRAPPNTKSFGMLMPIESQGA